MIKLTPLKIISHAKGNILHAMKKDSPGFTGFGEAYFSSINKGDIKGWKKHLRMTSNLIVPVGKVRFIIYTEELEKFQEVTLSQENYQRLTVPPGLWVAFQGLESSNLIINIADIIHDPKESISKDISEIIYNF